MQELAKFFKTWQQHPWIMSLECCAMVLGLAAGFALCWQGHAANLPVIMCLYLANSIIMLITNCARGNVFYGILAAGYVAINCMGVLRL